ncbi:PTS sugar transporter subunit IIA [Verrucomicrobiota bacterium sgz303538]
MTRHPLSPSDGNPLTAILEPERINLALDVPNEVGAICAVSSLLKAHSAIRDFERLQSELLEREKIGSTALASHVAFPHARSNYVDQIVMAAGRSRAGIPFGQSVQKVNLIFVIATPKEQASKYLEVVGRLARLCRNTQIFDRLLAAATAEEFLSVLQSPV